MLSAVRTLASRIAALFTARRANRRLDEELQSHLDLLIEQNLSRGLSPAGARRAARLSLGGPDQIKQSVRDHRGFPFLESIAQDVRFAARTLRKSPGFAAVAILTLALGIGANTAIFSVVNAVLLRPFPFKNSSRILLLYGTALNTGNLAQWRQQSSPSFDQFAAASLGVAALSNLAQPMTVRTEEVSADFFSLLGVRPALGRGFLPDDFQLGSSRAVIVSDAFWRRWLRSDPKSIGRLLVLDGAPYTVAGVMPRGLIALPYQGIDAWLPLLPGRSHSTEALAKLRSGSSLESARAEANLVAQWLATESARQRAERLIHVELLRDYLVSNSRPLLLLLSGAVGFVLLIACANIANLLLGQLLHRKPEIAIRRVLGASRARIARHVMIEALLLSASGALLGLIAAHWLADLFALHIPYYVPRMGQSKIDGPVLAFTALLTVVSALVFSLAPALAGSTLELNRPLNEGTRAASGSVGHRRLRGVLAITQVALAMMMLAGAGLLIRTFIALQPSSPGFDPADKLTLRFALPGSAPNREIAFLRESTERIAHMPGVRGVAAASYLPMTGMSSYIPAISVGGKIAAGVGQPVMVHYRISTPNYFQLMRMPIVAGRDFSAEDNEDAPKAAIINQSAAARLWPGQTAVGRQLSVAWSGTTTVPLTVIGVVRDARIFGDPPSPRPELYVPFSQDPRSAMSLVIHTSRPPLGFASAISDVLHSFDRAATVSDVQTMDQIVTDSVASQRFNARLFSILGALALILAVIGIYGVISYGVAQRTHEIGIRIALGAQRRDVLLIVIRGGLLLAAFGIAAGIAAALALTRFLSAFLYGVTPTDPFTFAAMAILLLLTALAACYIPARRATRVDPLTALRHE